MRQNVSMVYSYSITLTRIYKSVTLRLKRNQLDSWVKLSILKQQNSKRSKQKVLPTWAVRSRARSTYENLMYVRSNEFIAGINYFTIGNHTWISELNDFAVSNLLKDMSGVVYFRSWIKLLPRKRRRWYDRCTSSARSRFSALAFGLKYRVVH